MLVVPLNTRVCPNCGHEFQAFNEEKIFRNDALKQVHVDFSVKNNSFPAVKRAPKTPEEFLEIAKLKNYQIGWVAFQSLRFARSYDDCLHIAKVCGYKQKWAWYRWQDIQTKKAC